jgi:hypothetical protein
MNTKENNNTTFQHLRAAANKEITERYKKERQELNTTEGLQKSLKYNGRTYKKDHKKHLIRYLEKKEAKELSSVNETISAAEQAPDFKNNLIITLEWRDSRMWRSNPRAYTNFGFHGESIGGCGYDKTSTATAQALNSHLPLMKRLYAAKNRVLGSRKRDKSNRENLGYGSGYSIIPHFEGGVGIESHRKIIEGLELKWETVTSTNNTDVYMISRR